MSGYLTLDCRDGIHAACAVCSCRCHGIRSVTGARTRHRFDAPLVGFFVMAFAVIALLVIVAVLHLQLLQLRSVAPAPQVTDYQLVTK